MKKGTKLLLGGLTVAAAAAGAIGAMIVKRDGRPGRKRALAADRWARPGMQVTFRAELMPGRDAEERTYRVTDLLPSGRVLLDRVAGEHARQEFEQR
ncbi:MAG TPA: hypothetical protein VE863_02670 [Pyrinomonadaceae bacterium]|jgi:hypothetical protein|nr:hypothetical protein [Pyrinomonadaceae bacterium]